MHSLFLPAIGLQLVLFAGLFSLDGSSIYAAKKMETEDKYLWLEDVTGEQALDWAREQNDESTSELKASKTFEPLEERFLTILDSHERIPYVRKYGDYFYNFWQDEANPKGILRRTTFKEFRKDDPEWETVLDLDLLAKEENENWVWQGFTPLYPDYDRSLLRLSRGGADASVIREFSLKEKKFIDGGFHLPEAKSDIAWKDKDTLYVGTDFGEGSLTDSGYPRIIKSWKRGTDLADAKTIFEGKKEDVSAGVHVQHDTEYPYEFLSRSVTFWTNEVLVRRGDKWVKIEKPDDAEVDTFRDQILLTLRSDWKVDGKTYPAGALLACDFDAYLEGNRDMDLLFTPTERSSLDSKSGTKNWLLLNVLENVKNKIYRLRKTKDGWERQAVEIPDVKKADIWSVDWHDSDDYWLLISDFITPSSLYYGTVGKGLPEKVKSLPDFFDTEGLIVEQFEVLSKDGTRVPYFQVSREGMKHDGKDPTLLYGYGGFEIPMLPNYSAIVGSGWLEQEGVFVMANIRGGGEFGPKWHQAALKENRQRSYDDFIAVAEDLIERKVTSPEHLGIRGGSNGGLLVGNMLVQRPDLFKAIICGVPLLDMKRFNKLLAGASWVGEYGDPDNPDEWEYIQRYSPYHLVEKDAEYPRVLFTTSTRDDRVHPGHARKMVAKMKDQGHDVIYYENIEGGHGGAANNEQRAFVEALVYTFLMNELK
ncbi:prolyl oligopeptidase family serine peptidase [Rubellicoccus peritrichatus]|uniref:Prolyl oligopeptidase family serine peptidase n=1 Tax=Rubellicoccus peritrichatus TaxID=3080537 RepID=A0AAQ3LC67_9BACT|nr:prolyl oligopeptidase family serine peptidase [Puniceicoccus sp. CR14]WOO40828.1 prolyl oligopeptidase family serine peptidase [Puniceicoccus sp. CR14]